MHASIGSPFALFAIRRQKLPLPVEKNSTRVVKANPLENFEAGSAHNAEAGEASVRKSFRGEIATGVPEKNDANFWVMISEKMTELLRGEKICHFLNCDVTVFSAGLSSFSAKLFQTKLT